MRGLICFIYFVICCRVFGFNQPEIIEDLLDSRNGFVWRNFEEEGNIRYIVLHYIFSQTYDLSKKYILPAEYPLILQLIMTEVFIKTHLIEEWLFTQVYPLLMAM